MPGPRVAVLRVVAVLAVVVLGQVEAWTIDPAGSHELLLALCVLVASCSLLLVHTSPDVAAILVVGALVAKDLARGPGEVLTLLLCGVVTAFAVGLLLPALRARLTLAVLVALSALGVVLGPEDLPELAFSAIALSAPWFAGRLVRGSREHARVLEELMVLREVEASERARHAVAQERTAIAREIHDLVGHSVSLMVLQAGAAGEVLGSRPDHAGRALDSIQQTGRAALDDLHRVLGLLRSDPSADAVPVPGLDQIPSLEAAMSQIGLEVAWVVDGDLADLPAGLSLTAYRILQEALTNVARHAGGASAEVLVERSQDELLLRVTDNGSGPDGPVDGGHGLVGIRERVALYDGDLVCGPRAAGGFGVEARLPLGAPT